MHVGDPTQQDVDQVVGDPGTDVSPGRDVEGPRFDPGLVGRGNGGGEEAECLEAVLGGALGADEAPLGLSARSG